LGDVLERDARGESDFLDLNDGLLWAESIAAQLDAKLDKMMEESDGQLTRADR
jgi:hypothetical protein